MSLKHERNILVLGLFFVLFLFSIRTGSAEEPEKDPAQSFENPRSYTVHLVGHTHIDLSWLWRWEETVREIADIGENGAEIEVVERGPVKETGYAERGLILRFCETFGRATDVRVLLPWAVAAENADLLERPVRGKKGPVEISDEGREVRLTLKPYEIRTVRVVRKPEN